MAQRPIGVDSEDGRATIPHPRAAAELPETIRPGDVLADGQFRIEGSLGAGGMASVFRATDLRRGKEVALKVIAPRYAGRPDREKRFDNEARLAARLAGHRNVVAPLSSGRLGAAHGRRMYLAMELARGPTLLDLVSMHGRLPVADAIVHIRDVARALRDLHDSGVVHRDVKPSNVIVVETDEGPVAKLIDFGLAADVDESAEQSSRLTRAGERPGTHHYMSPEQAFGAPAQPSTDVYGLGATLFELLTGEPPWHELSASEVIQRKCELDQPGPSLAGRVRGLPPGLVELVDDALRPKAAERIPSAATFLQRLDEIRSGAGIPTAKAGAHTGMVGVARTVDTAPGEHKLEQIVADAKAAKAVGRPGPAVLTPVRTGATRPEVAADRIALAGAMRGATVPAEAAVPRPRGATELAPAAGPTPARGVPSTMLLATIAGVLAVALGGVAAWWLVGRTPSSTASRDSGASPSSATAIAAAGDRESAATDEPAAGPDDATSSPVVDPPPPIPDPPPPPPPPETDTANEPEPNDTALPDVDDAGAGSPGPTPPPRVDAWTPAKCAAERDEAAKALAAGRYAGALSHTRIPKCWPSATARDKIRVQAYFELSRYDDCIDAGSSSSDPTVQRTVRRCQKARDAK